MRSSLSRVADAVELEIVVPAFNEADRLAGSLKRAAAFLETQPWTSRLVVVDNGSSDDSAAVAASVPTGRVGIEVIGCAEPGKGAAVRRGLSACTAPYAGFFDADLSTPVETLTRTMAELRAGAAAVIASRHAPGARFVTRQPLGRRVGGRVFRTLTRPLVPCVRDTQCGFKFFRRTALGAALERCRVDGFAFDVELLRRVRAAGGEIVEVPVDWTDDRRSTFHPVRDGIASFASVVSLYRTAVAR
ncbi:glycosyltransferase [Actinosynnema pretiosum subsp. pretiosum]|uniref:Glycosyl transferase family 2 n=2 Tax=Actinosynnema TaxID=40566 RepID=C6WQU2_ACTMD|nr:glycosyltransferase [Actinosynnema mirum]ACU38782.1 glycosyl transferase family 2 [Actinosynnema mirum DSM 43827]AXX32379.1 glycosyl transferase, family 2 [Actinosynnema pretiosum subsp. pretiosum]QUF03685.1 glycosyltransferase [Actinosynnema pretiosum subsp. pretiosum]